MSDNNLLKNIFLQAKRASKILDIPLTQSKNLIAQSIYQCHDFSDLCSKLDNYSLKATVYPFCKLNLQSDENSKSHILKNIDTLAEQFSRYLAGPLSQYSLLDLIWKIFGFKNHAQLEDAFPHFSLENWQPYTLVYKDSVSVLYHDFKINSVPFRLLLTRVVNAEMFTNNTQNELLILENELSKFKYTPILWHDWSSWQNTVFSYFNTRDLSQARHGKLFDKLVEPKTKSQKEFEQKVYESMQILADEFVGTSIRNCDFDREFLYIVGFPVSERAELKNYTEFYLTESHINNGKCLLGIGDNILALELFEVDSEGKYTGDAESYYTELSDVLQKFEGATRQHVLINSRRYEAYLRLTTNAEYVLNKNSAITLVDNFGVEHCE
ncbi:hypothetical protein [Thalassotalea profundi]|uniref:Uncharacterized protein n=1 Tax=Thalassotalea profundi TaxID=2036687 RepID=A0ABQ3IST1_9GAMM|nr:hypothetical protein [Thalassotalea profundi]GHE92402.1 hypothetical protein GCM10011501_22430 [Thalassotalea profundi]